MAPSKDQQIISLKKQLKRAWATNFKTRDKLILSTIQSKVSPEIIRTLKEIILDTSSFFDCSICKEEIAGKKIAFLKCGHFTYHTNCLTKWSLINPICPTCPECRAPIDLYCFIQL